MLRKKGFWGINGGRLTFGKNNMKGSYLPPKHVFGCIERKATLYGVLWRGSQGTKKNKKARANVQLHPSPAYTLNAASTKFGVWGRVTDVINRAKFQLNPFRGFGVPGAEVGHFPWTRGIALTTVLRTNVLHCGSVKLTTRYSSAPVTSSAYSNIAVTTQ